MESIFTQLNEFVAETGITVPPSTRIIDIVEESLEMLEEDCDFLDELADVTFSVYMLCLELGINPPPTHSEDSLTICVKKLCKYFNKATAYGKQELNVFTLMPSIANLLGCIERLAVDNKSLPLWLVNMALEKYRSRLAAKKSMGSGRLG